MTLSSVFLSGAAQSPDLNPIQLFWDGIEREIHSIEVLRENLQELHDAIMSAWTGISKKGLHLLKSEA